MTDSGGDPPSSRRDDPDGGFAFNLGNALARLGLDDDSAKRASARDPLASLRSALTGGEASAPPAEPAALAPSPAAPPELPNDLPRRQAANHDEVLPRRHAPTIVPPDTGSVAPVPAVAVDPVVPPSVVVPAADVRPAFTEPIRAASAPVEQAFVEQAFAEQAPVVDRAPVDVAPTDAVPRPYVAPRRSVFDDVVSPSPALPPTVVSEPPRPTPAVTQQLTQPAVQQPAVQQPAVQQPAVQQTSAPVAPMMTGAPVLPTLPAVVPVTAPPVAMPAHDPVAEQADLRALRSAQLRATRQRRTGKVIARTFLILLVLGGLVAGAMTFGRSYLFPVEWDPALTELVDVVQTERGADFDHTVGLVAQTDEEFELTVLRLTIGTDWEARVPEWRALGLVAGAPTSAGIARDVANGTLAIYDPAVDRIYMPASSDVTLAESDLRVALEQAYDAQLGALPTAVPPTRSFAGVSAGDVIAQRAVDQYLAARDASAPAVETPRGGNLPLPVEYELLAADRLGEAVLTAAGADPATATFATDVSAVLPTVLDDAPKQAAPVPLQIGESAVIEPVALGSDDWSLVWGTRLPATTVDRLVTLVIADSYQVIDRNGTICAVGVFEAASAESALIVAGALQTWVAAAPPASVATVTGVADTRVQLTACDPGPDAALDAPATSAAALLDRQLVRLAG